MTALERRSSFSLASIFALRMLGLFLVLPVFVLEARKYPGGDDAARLPPLVRRGPARPPPAYRVLFFPSFAFPFPG